MKNNRKMNHSKKGIRYISLLTFGSLLLIIWEMLLFRKTFIPVLIPLLVFFIGGFIAFISLRKRINYYIQNDHNIFLQGIHGIILFGGILMFVFMASNFYFTSGKEKIYELKVESTGYLARGRRGCGNPYAIVNYNNTEKQLIFPCNTDLENSTSIKVALNEGLFGFVVINKMKPLISSSGYNRDSMVDEHKEYLKILSKAEEHYKNGNKERSIELYERAATFNPNDERVKLRLEEIKSEMTTNVE